MAATYSPRLKDRYKAEIVDNLKKQFQYTSAMQVH